MPAFLIILAAIIGYSTFPVLSPLLDDPALVDSFLLHTLPSNSDMSANLQPVIYPDRKSIKLLLDHVPELIDDAVPEQAKKIWRQASIDAAIVRPIVPGMGSPRAVKAFKIAPDGQYVDGDPFSNNH